MELAFLRLLEYFRGFMILTTNRAVEIDPAFESRIDLTLLYEDLEAEDRAKIWRNFLCCSPNIDSSLTHEECITELAKRSLNGRQIKSAVKTAKILAAGEQQPLTLEHIQTVLKIRDQARKALRG